MTFLIAKVGLKASLEKGYSPRTYLADVLQEGEEERRVRFRKEVVVIETPAFILVENLLAHGAHRERDTLTRYWKSVTKRNELRGREHLVLYWGSAALALYAASTRTTARHLIG
jgi:hypothetical protein